MVLLGLAGEEKNSRDPWRLTAGTLKRLLWTDTMTDLFVRRSLPLAKLDLELGLVKLRALRAASQDANNYGW